MSFWEYLDTRHRQLLTDAGHHAFVVFLCVVATAVLGVLIAVVTRGGDRAGGLATTAGATILTVPSLALIGLLILTGIRVSTRMLMGIAALAAYVSGPGLGNEIFRGIASPGSASALDQVLAGTLGIIVLALLFDAAYVVVGRLTIPGGIRG
ncbi:ABC transporter permease [Streptomyces sp. NPDC096132]|uniref:ABC transporter permease n=1 Tax=Streptomyces sp. NPDC096132 TaxID=3366075 RepID=UPI00383045E3